ncbi:MULTISPECIES: hypothetical protein [unclassified Curtobacterium]|uniref:hypothetical protein n=1 Tax=unclassified Curtobacterium TaxID=257496 RepID=UPI0015E8E5DA|nr:MULTISPECIES: hypothetical protein [unclassified Curtobacterium]QZQ53625.1 hypothetical protein KZI27_00620 [Curtobacterium sp. TC1]QZQ55563.1 hypothetical protein KZI27_01450 [Curtobacterium sp. TC1]WIE74141.1 hypothetical protein DEJ14_018705 [Curtobacterium sp. MCJR17_020]
MGRMWTRRPHRLVLPAAAACLLLGIGLLLSPWDGLVTIAAWILILVACIGGTLTLFLMRTPSS